MPGDTWELLLSVVIALLSCQEALAEGVGQLQLHLYSPVPSVLWTALRTPGPVVKVKVLWCVTSEMVSQKTCIIYKTPYLERRWQLWTLLPPAVDFSSKFWPMTFDLTSCRFTLCSSGALLCPAGCPLTLGN